MTSNSSIIDSLTSPPVKSVQVANGNSMPMTGAGHVSLSPTFSISSVLLASKLSNNLLSISKIKNLTCYVTFHSIHCVFQDNLKKITNVIGKERDGLYYLEDDRGIVASKVASKQRERHLIEREFSFGIVIWDIHLFLI